MYPPLLENSTYINELRGLNKEIPFCDICLSGAEIDVNIFKWERGKLNVTTLSGTLDYCFSVV